MRLGTAGFGTFVRSSSWLPLPFVASISLASLGCSSSSTEGSKTAPPIVTSEDAGAEPIEEVEEDAGAQPPPSACAPPPKKSICGEGAWVRGIATFDPKTVEAGDEPVLRVALRHKFVLEDGEETIGGRLHGWINVPITDPSKGTVPFAIDMCDLGTSMWSEENGAFHLVMLLDLNGDNDLDKAKTQAQAITFAMPSPGEPVKMVDVEVSCKAGPACVEARLDCVDASCLTFEPMKSCKKRKPGCNSDSSFCR